MNWKVVQLSVVVGGFGFFVFGFSWIFGVCVLLFHVHSTIQYHPLHTLDESWRTTPTTCIILRAQAPRQGLRISMWAVIPVILVIRTTDSMLKRKNQIKSPAISEQLQLSWEAEVPVLYHFRTQTALEQIHSYVLNNSGRRTKSTKHQRYKYNICDDTKTKHQWYKYNIYDDAWCQLQQSSGYSQTNYRSCRPHPTFVMWIVFREMDRTSTGVKSQGAGRWLWLGVGVTLWSGEWVLLLSQEQA